MKHTVKRFLPLLLTGFILTGCAHTVREEELAGKTYCYEKDGFGGPFTITLEEDGSFTYYEGSLSSYIGTGTWTLEGDTLTLQEKNRHFTFRVSEEELIFRHDQSGNFLYVDVFDGEKFSMVQ